MSRQHFLAIGVRSAAWVLIVTMWIGSGFAQAQGWETDFGSYLVGSRNAAELMNALSFTDLPSGPEAGSIVRLAAQGVLRGDGSGRFNPKAAVTREQAMTALVRLLGWDNQPIVASGNNQSMAGVSDWAARFISIAMAQGLTGDSGNKKSSGTAGTARAWYAPATREEVAAWCIRVLENTVGTGSMVGSVVLAAYSDAGAISPELKGLVQYALEIGLIEPTAPGQLNPQGQVTRSELAVMLDQLTRYLPPNQSVSWEIGVLDEQIIENEEIAGLPARSALWTMVRPGGSKAALKLSSDYQGRPLAQAVVYRQGRLFYGNVLQPGNTVRYLVQGDQTVPFIEVLPAGPVTVYGRIERIDAPTKQLVLRDDSFVAHHLLVSPTISITIDGKPASVSDLVADMEITATVIDSMVLEIAARATANYDDADPPELKVSGRVRTVDSQSLLLVLADGRTARYDINSSTQVMAQGQVSTLNAIQPGDQVQLYLPSPTSTWVRQVVVAGPAARVVDLVRGRLGSFAPRSGHIVLTDVQCLNSGVWEKVAGTMDLPLRSDTTLWHESQEIDLTAAAQLTGSEVYAAISDGFGRPEALRVIIWRGQEKSYEGAIDEINPGLGLVTLPNAELILSPGAIVLKDGRLADPHGLEEGDSIQALTRRAGTSSLGLVVSVLGKEQRHFPGFTIYRGRVENVGRTAFTLTSYQTFTDGTWSSRRRRESDDLGLSRDTVIVSMLDEEPARLTLDQFRQGLWQDRYDDAEVLALTEDGDTLALALWTVRDLDAARLSRAQMVAVTEQGTPPEADGVRAVSIVLRDLTDFSPAKDTWQNAGTKVELDAGRALVIKNGRAYTGEALAVGDDIIFLRRGETVMLAWVKE